MIVDYFLCYPTAMQSLRQLEEIHQRTQQVRLCFIFLMTSASLPVVPKDTFMISAFWKDYESRMSVKKSYDKYMPKCFQKPRFYGFKLKIDIAGEYK